MSFHVGRHLGSRYNVPILSFGASGIAGVFNDFGGEAAVSKVVAAALGHGMFVMDTAPWYGNGLSEQRLGEALTGVPRDAYKLHTKVGRYSPDIMDMFDFRASRVRESVFESMERLKVDYLDLVQVHDPEFAPSLDIVVGETLPALAQLKEEGHIGGIGITGYPLDVLYELAEKSSVEIDSALSYCHYNLHDSSLETSGLLSYFRNRGVAVINASPMSMGLLTEGGPPAWHPSSYTLRKRCRLAHEFAKSQGVSLSKLALAFSTSRPLVSTTLVSASSLEVLESNAKVVNPTLHHSKSDEAFKDALQHTSSGADTPEEQNHVVHEQCDRVLLGLTKRERLVLAAILLHFFPHTIVPDAPEAQFSPVPSKPSGLRTVLQIALAHATVPQQLVQDIWEAEGSYDAELEIVRVAVLEELTSSVPDALPLPPVAYESSAQPPWWSWEGAEVNAYWKELGKTLQLRRLYDDDVAHL